MTTARATGAADPLASVDALIEGLGLIQSLVTLHPDQRQAEQGRCRERQLRLADAG